MKEQLVLKDLCARLPYGVIVQDRNGTHVLTPGNTELGTEYIKPYLRPMSSMTEEEKEIINNLIYNDSCFLSPIPIWTINESDVEEYIDFCNSHHLDWRGLIEKGLALEAPKGIYKTE